MSGRRGTEGFRLVTGEQVIEALADAVEEHDEALEWAQTARSGLRAQTVTPSSRCLTRLGRAVICNQAPIAQLDRATPS